MSVAILGLLLLVRKQRLYVSKPLIKPVLLLGLIWSGAMISYLMSVQFVSVSVAVLILYTYPLIVLLVCLVTGKMRSSLSVMMLFVVAFVGVGMMLMKGEYNLSALGVSLAVLAALGAAYTFLAGERVAPRLNPVVLTFWVNVVGLIMIVPFVLDRYSLPEGNEGLMALAGATVCYIVAIVCQFQALSKVSSSTAAFVLNSEPVVSIMLALLVLNESLTGVQWIGVGLVMAVLFVFTVMTSRENTAKGH